MTGGREHRSDPGHRNLWGDRGGQGLHRRQGKGHLDRKNPDAIIGTIVQYFKTDVVFFNVQSITHVFIDCFFFLMNKYVHKNNMIDTHLASRMERKEST